MSDSGGHVYFQCDCNKANCMFCDGGLASCTVCKGGEGSLTTECCGRPLTSDEIEGIFTIGNLDFRDGRWVKKTTPNRRAV